MEKEITEESDGGILFLPDEKRSSTEKSESKAIAERKPTEKDVPPTYFYFVMELCQPESLRDRLIQRSIDRPQAWSIFDQIVRGIEYIHSQKLVRRTSSSSSSIQHRWILDPSRFETVEHSLLLGQYRSNRRFRAGFGFW